MLCTIAHGLFATRPRSVCHPGPIQLSAVEETGPAALHNTYVRTCYVTCYMCYFHVMQASAAAKCLYAGQMLSPAGAATQQHLGSTVAYASRGSD
jgi:hypothetical protein